MKWKSSGQTPAIGWCKPSSLPHPHWWRAKRRLVEAFYWSVTSVRHHTNQIIGRKWRFIPSSEAAAAALCATIITIGNVYEWIVKVILPPRGVAVRWGCGGGDFGGRKKGIIKIDEKTFRVIFVCCVELLSATHHQHAQMIFWSVERFIAFPAFPFDGHAHEIGCKQIDNSNGWVSQRTPTHMIVGGEHTELVVVAGQGAFD